MRAGERGAGMKMDTPSSWADISLIFVHKRVDAATGRLHSFARDSEKYLNCPCTLPILAELGLPYSRDLFRLREAMIGLWDDLYAAADGADLWSD